jgi:RimJ/RimL family protein N-acetyltransferase
MQAILHQQLEQRYPKTIELTGGFRYVVRPLLPTDRERLWRFFKDTPEEDRLFLKHDVSREETITTWCTHIDYEKVLPLLALQGDDVCADATLHMDRGGWQSHIGTVRVVVHPKHRGRGLASALIRELMEIAAFTGLDYLEAECLADQERMLRLFERLGFSEYFRLPRRVRDRKMQYHDLVVLSYALRPEAFEAD